MGRFLVLSVAGLLGGALGNPLFLAFPWTLIPSITSGLASVPVVALSLQSKPLWRSLALALIPTFIVGTAVGYPVLDGVGFCSFGGVLKAYAATTLCLWLMCLVTALTVRDRGARPAGHSARCRCCGYDLTGNVSLRCPECGVDVEPAGDRVARPNRRHAALQWGWGVTLGCVLIVILFVTLSQAM